MDAALVQFTRADDALYERHLVFDNVLEAAAIASVLKPSPALCAMSFRNDGFKPRRPTNAGIRSAFTTFRWNFSSVVRG